jgi:hypothetical protein
MTNFKRSIVFNNVGDISFKKLTCGGMTTLGILLRPVLWHEIDEIFLTQIQKFTLTRIELGT